MNYRSMMALTFAATALAGCDRLSAAWQAFQAPSAATPISPQPAPPQPAPPQPGPPTSVAPLTPVNKGTPVKAQPELHFQQSASVIEVHPLAAITGMDGHVFGTAGGDPAMNGLQTFIAFYRSAADGWWVYQVGNFLSFRILNQTRGQVDLEVEESTMNEATGEIGKRTRRIIIAFVVAPADTHPVNVRFMPAA